jgi:hypothetical protein
MTYQNDFTLSSEILEQIAENGLKYLPELIRTMINTAMKPERQKYLKADLYERNEDRQGHANGYKDKTVVNIRTEMYQGYSATMLQEYSAYHVFPPAEARRLTERFEFHFTPKHGSWLIMAEIELSVWVRQCVDRRIPDQQVLAEEVKACKINITLRLLRFISSSPLPTHASS